MTFKCWALYHESFLRKCVFRTFNQEAVADADKSAKKKWVEKFFIYITKKIVQVIFSLQKLKPRVIN